MDEYRRYQTEEQRAEVVARWVASGLSQAEFCRRENIPEWALSTWKRRVDQSGRKDPAPAKKKKRKSSKKKDAIAQTAKLRKKLIAEQIASGRSVDEFCKLNGITIKNFNRWKQESAGSAPKAAKAMPDPSTSSNPFVAVRVVSEAAAVSMEQGVELILPGGSKIKVTEKTPLDLLFKVFKVLEGKC
jgi:Transposase